MDRATFRPFYVRQTVMGGLCGHQHKYLRRALNCQETGRVCCVSRSVVDGEVIVSIEPVERYLRD
jgi:hypothetical protein